MKKAIKESRNKMDYLLLLSQQLICCITLLLIKFVPVSDALPFATNITNPVLGKVLTGPSDPSKSPASFHRSETAKFHIQPTRVKQMVETNINLIAAFTEAPIHSKSESTRQHHRHQHKHRHLTHSLKGSQEHQLHQSTKFIIEPSPTNVQPMQTKAPHFGDTNSIITVTPIITFTEVLSDFPKPTTSSLIQTSGGSIGRRMTSTSTFPKDFTISRTSTSIGIKASIFPVVHPPTDSESTTLQQTPTTPPVPGPASPDNLTSDQTPQDETTSKNSIPHISNSTPKHPNLETAFKTMVNNFANLTEQSAELERNNQTGPNKSVFNQDRNALFNEAMANKTITSVYIQPTPILMMPYLKTKYNPSQFNDPTKDSTQRPARNILSLNRKGLSKWKVKSKDLLPSRSGLLHLTENDQPTSYVHKPMISHKKDFTSLPRDGDGKVLAAITTEFMKSSEVIPDLFVTPTKSQRIHSTKSAHEAQAGRTGPSSVTAALSFKSKNEHMILSATATLSPSRMTYTCTIPCSQTGCQCCQDQQGTATVTRRPPSNTTPNIQVSTDKSLTEQISLSAKFGIGMGCLIAIWLVVGPVVCLICRIRDQVKEGEGNLDGMEKRMKKKKQMQKEKSSGSKGEHPLTEAIVMDELNRQFSKKKNSRENEYLLLAKDKAELECLSRVDLSKTITKKQMSTFDRTRSPHCLNKWDESDIEDDSEEEEDEDEDDEKERFTPISNTPTVSV